MKRRDYPSYSVYAEHQAAKLDTLTLDEYDRTFTVALASRLSRLGAADWHGRSVLCLGARTGAEVRAFITVGAFAVGIDLNPGPENRYVVAGDFNALQYADASVDAVYSNSLDHAFKLDLVTEEIRRVMKPDGVALIEAVNGSAEGGPGLGAYESLSWDTLDELIAALHSEGLTCRDRVPFMVPWVGEQLQLEIAP